MIEEAAPSRSRSGLRRPMEMGYGRRKGEVEELEKQLTAEKRNPKH